MYMHTAVFPFQGCNIIDNAKKIFLKNEQIKLRAYDK